jgi:hypothetical protein
MEPRMKHRSKGRIRRRNEEHNQNACLTTPPLDWPAQVRRLEDQVQSMLRQANEIQAAMRQIRAKERSPRGTHRSHHAAGIQRGRAHD